MVVITSPIRAILLLLNGAHLWPLVDSCLNVIIMVKFLLRELRHPVAANESRRSPPTIMSR